MTWTCSDCTTAYSVGAPRCPHCGSTNHTEDPMGKITAAGGPTDSTTELVDVEPAEKPVKAKSKKDEGPVTDEAAPDEITGTGSITLPPLGAGGE